MTITTPFSLPKGFDITIKEDVGRTLITTCPFQVGNTLFCERPLVGWSSGKRNSEHEFSLKSLFNELQLLIADIFKVNDDPLLMETLAAFTSLSEDILSRVKDFARPPDHHESAQKYKVFVDRIALIKGSPAVFGQSSQLEWKSHLLHFLLACYTNAHHRVMEDQHDCGLFEIASKIAHACSPSVVFFFEKNDQLKFVAIRDIGAQEVLSCSYLDELDLLMPVEIRQRVLEHTKFFQCQCARCCMETNLSSSNLTLRAALRLRKSLGRPAPVDWVLNHETSRGCPSSAHDQLMLDLLLGFQTAVDFYRLNLSTVRFLAEAAHLPLKLVFSSYLFFKSLSELLIKKDVHPILAVRWLLCGTSTRNGDLPCLLEWLQLVGSSQSTDLSALERLQILSNWQDRISGSLDLEQTLNTQWKDTEWSALDSGMVDLMIGDLVSRCWPSIVAAKKCGVLDGERFCEEDFSFLKHQARKFIQLSRKTKT